MFIHECRTIQRLITETEDLVNLVPMVFSICIADRYPSGATFDVDNFELIIQRYSLRALYHANNFISRLLSFAETKDIPPNETLGYHIGPEIYFEFDAFLYSSKSIFEENMLKKGKQYFKNDRKTRFKRIAKETFEGFIKILTAFRNEAVHLNYWGTSNSQAILIANRDGQVDLHLHTTFRNAAGEELNLIDVFIRLCSDTSRVIRDLVTLVIKEIVHKYGQPENTAAQLHIRNSTFQINDFLD